MSKQRLLDPILKEIRRELHSMQRHVDDLVSDALITLKDPKCGLGENAQCRDEEVNRLEEVIQGLADEAFTRFQPVARDHRFLQSVMAIIQDLEHMGDRAKNICGVAPRMGEPLDTLRQLSHLVQRRVSDCFRALHQLDLVDTGLAERIVTGRHESEELCERVQAELVEAGSHWLGPREQQSQVLVAQDLQRISNYTISIANQLIFYNTGSRRFLPR